MSISGGRVKIAVLFNIIAPAKVPVYSGLAAHFNMLLLHGGMESNRTSWHAPEKKIIGAPDLVVEVASPSTAAFDRLIKYEKYAHAGIAEYWIVKPTSRTVEVMVLEPGEYRSLGIFSGKAQLPSRVIPGLHISVEQFFM